MKDLSMSFLSPPTSHQPINSMSIAYSPTALQGFSAASAYDAHRPSYIPAAVSNLLTELSVANVPRARILDLAAGTGKFTELICRREEGFEIVAVEPHEEMRATLEKKGLAGVKVVDGNAYGIPVEDGWADAVVIAQAFHWFAKPEALAELFRVLRPGGKFGLIWNIEDYNQTREYPTTTKWEEEMKLLNWKYTTDSSPRYKNDQWRKVFEGETRFSMPVGEKIYPVEIWLGEEALWNRLNTLSNVANLSQGDKEEMRKGLYRILRDGEDVERNDRREIAVHYIVHTVWTAKG